MATITYKCPNCGGGMVFDPGSQKFRCEFCLSEYTQAQLDKLQMAGASDQVIQDAYAAQPEEYPEEPVSGAGGSSEAGDGYGNQAQSYAQDQHAGRQDSAVIYTCPSCGAEIVTDETTAATFCYYCHNPVVLEGRVSGKYLPDRIIPFKLDKKAATEHFLDFVKSKRFVPKAFFNEEQIEKLSGVYYPFWVYDCEVDGGIEARGNRIRMWRSGMFEYTETSVYEIERAGQVHVQNITRNALKESERNLIDAVRPFHMEDATDFAMPYLQGFVAQKRDIETEEVSGELQKTAANYARNAMMNTVTGYSSVNGARDSLRPVREKWQYLLLPVWLLTYGANSGKTYYFAMNGQTGEIKGKLPIDYGKLTRVSGIVGGALAAACLLASYFIL